MEPAPPFCEEQLSKGTLARARAIVHDLRSPRRWIYWGDSILTAAVTWGAIALAASGAGGAAATVAGVIVAALGLCRAAILLHDLIHLPRGAVPGLGVLWNLLLGIPFLLPSFLYDRVHRDHHRREVYRTLNDPEHAPDHSTLAARVATTLAIMALFPFALATRWLVLAPSSWLSPSLRRWVDARASSLCGNPRYRPSPLVGRARREALLAEIVAFGWAATLALLVWSGTLPIRVLLLAAAAVALGGALSSLRGELLHRFSNLPLPMTYERQVQESLNVPAGFLGAIFLQAGIGYHALHHLDPKLPYHALGEAHRRLLARLPAGSFYHQATLPSFGAALGRALAGDAARR